MIEIIVQLPNKNDVLQDDVEKWFESKQITYENGSLAIWLSNKKENLDGIEKNDAKPIAVIIKQAVATGWDCPRAHILVKLRDNMNETFEIQTIGRIRRMPEAHHYGNDLLDCCYLYTIDDKFTDGVLSNMGKGALNAIKLYLKKEHKDFSLNGQYKSGLANMPRNSKQALGIITEYFTRTYKLGTNWNTNTTRLETSGYDFSTDVVKHTVSGDVRQLKQSEFENLNDVNLREHLDTHKHGREFHHEIANIGLKIGLSYDQMNIIVRRIFVAKENYPKRILDLGIRQLYAFVINNSDKLRHDIQNAMAIDLQQTALPQTDKIVDYEFTIPQETIFTYNGKSIDQSVMTKNVYGGYLLSAEPRSDSERAFEKFCETCPSVKWLYKNGDKGSEYLSIVYTDNFGKLKSFFPDYIVGMQNGETWIVETKGGFDHIGKSEDIDSFSPKKFEVLKTYIQKYNLKGGFVRKDKLSQELCICTEQYSNDIQSDDWELLKKLI